MNQRTIIIIAIAVVVLIVGIGVGVYFLTRSSSSKTDYTVSVITRVSNVKEYTGKLSLKQSGIANMTIQSFVNTNVQNVSGLPPLNVITWTSLSVNNKPIQSDSIKKMSTLFNPIPVEIDLYGEFNHACPDKDKPTVDHCQRVKGICTAPGPYCDKVQGWICKENQVCPGDLSSCCTDSKKPIASCDPDTKEITCEECDESKKPNCVGVKNCDPCKGCGPKCTSGGWVCAENTVCPSNPSVCCADPNKKYPICGDFSNYEVQCEQCPGPLPANCDPNCTGQAPVCQPKSGTFTCENHVQEPPADVMATCCSEPTPIPYWDDKEKTVKCKNCGGCTGDPNNYCPPGSGKICQQSCQGRGCSCTSSGCACVDGVRCPDYDWSKNCCPGDLVPDCGPHTGNKVVCTCPADSYPCGSGENMVCCQNECCQNSPPGTCKESCCNSPIGSNQKLCCNKEQACLVGNSAICCPEGTVCQDNNCVAMCGLKPCDVGEKCVRITGLTPSRIQKLKEKYGDKITIQGGVAYLCVLDKSVCKMSLTPGIAPPGIGDYYPCYAFPSSDQYGTGYCVPKDGSDPNCSVHQDPGNCNKDTSCEWRDVLEYMASSPDTAGSAQQIQKDIENMDSNKYGNYCDPTTSESFQRVIAHNLSGSCDVTDCINYLAQPGVTDIDWNENTQVCAVLQSCNSGQKGLVNDVVNVDDNRKVEYIPNPSIQPPIRGDNNFGSCGSSYHCPNGVLQEGMVCDSTSGRINDKTYNCVVTDDPEKGSQRCELVYDGTGQYNTSSCDHNCVCAHGFVSGSGGGCYQQPFLVASAQQYGACGGEFSSCHKANNVCGPYYSTIGGFGNDCQTTGCQVYCEPVNVPKGFKYCNPKTQQWETCTQGGCHESNGFQAVNNNSWSVTPYCKIP